VPQRRRDSEVELVKRINALALRHPRYGYRRITALLRADGWPGVNRKRVQRLWRTEGLHVP
jgi:putative transposase